ncbi:unnamed protein product [Arabis nemorensis]|uniref:Uncharacterized protein n=1 Tax=Arabis nemorensis TaxID=586526 RepID=A0A565C505_9BRAS|nr:unnamed protein product [Arabis nemorensis]
MLLRFGLKNDITNTISTMLYTQLPKGYYTYSSLPIETRDLWFSTFAQVFTWEPAIMAKVRIAFDKQAKSSFSSHMYEWGQSWVHKKGIAKGINPDIWDDLVLYWQLESTMSTSKTNSKNRKSERDGKGIVTHNLGAKSTQRVAYEMTQETGEELDLLALIRTTHTNKKKKIIDDLKARELIESIEQKKIDLETQRSQVLEDGSVTTNHLSIKESNNLVVQELPVDKKGRTFGIGSYSVSQCNSSPSVNTSTNAMYEEKLEEREAKMTSMQQELDMYKDWFCAKIP